VSVFPVYSESSALKIVVGFPQMACPSTDYENLLIGVEVQ
jgi:hypothetical protein